MSPTWLQNWPKPLRALAIPFQGFELDAEQHAALDEAPPLYRDRLLPTDPPGLRSLALRLAPMVAAQTGGAFVRLGSASPKDSPIFGAQRGRCTNEVTAIRRRRHVGGACGDEPLGRFGRPGAL